MKLLFLTLLVAFLFGCSSSDSKKESSKEDSKSTENEKVQDSPLTEEEEKKMEELLDKQSDSDYIGNDARPKKKN